MQQPHASPAFREHPRDSALLALAVGEMTSLYEVVGRARLRELSRSRGRRTGMCVRFFARLEARSAPMLTGM